MGPVVILLKGAISCYTGSAPRQNGRPCAGGGIDNQVSEVVAEALRRLEVGYDFGKQPEHNAQGDGNPVRSGVGGYCEVEMIEQP